ncbi:MAG: hypothetical protein P4N60_09555 [Verrucomicrobiae bacterium]|nr:hypothetical protein [Verrucomicrobiae bacterium]
MAAAVLLASAAMLQAEPALLGNKGLTGQALDADSIKAVLLGKKATIGDTRVVIVIIKGSESQEAFLEGHIGMSTDQFNTYWRRLYMTGGGSAPKNVDTEDEASKVVASTPGAIAVIDSAKADGLTVLASK